MCRCVGVSAVVSAPQDFLQHHHLQEQSVLLFVALIVVSAALKTLDQQTTMRSSLSVLLTAACLLSVSSFSFSKMARRTFLTSSRPSSWQLQAYSNDHDDDEDVIDADSLGDWRAFRRNLAGMTTDADSESNKAASSSCAENERVLRTQNEALANEYRTGVWAHETSTVRCVISQILYRGDVPSRTSLCCMHDCLTIAVPPFYSLQPEIGGLVCRLPLEVEIYRNFKHSLIGKKLRKTKLVLDSTKEWYKSAQSLVETEMQHIAESAQGGHIDATTLNDEAAEMLQLYIDNQVRPNELVWM